ncbi:MAG: histidine triad nucleotide-binding protein [Vampirovibrionales bacterium]|nr:histidine triad nucleotide-binding protein [Vampirovibrionales bacterium]
MGSDSTSDSNNPQLQDCLFCKMVRGEIPIQKVFEDDHTLAFDDINPQAPTHVLIIPKTHTDSIADTKDPAIFAHVLASAQKIAEAKSLSHFRIVSNNGQEAGQSVFHLHIHLLAGRPLSWPPG